VDNRHQEEPVVDAEEAKKWCSVTFGVGGDGIIFALPPVGDTDFSMRLFNSDGSEPEMCGNGIRCLAKFVAELDGVTTATYNVHTLAGACYCPKNTQTYEYAEHPGSPSTAGIASSQ
jgi:diaminopimelate epimerase